jgi:hypothetical protein
VIHFIYTDEYLSGSPAFSKLSAGDTDKYGWDESRLGPNYKPDGQINLEYAISILKIDTLLYSAADRYQMPQLKAKALEQYRQDMVHTDIFTTAGSASLAAIVLENTGPNDAGVRRHFLQKSLDSYVNASRHQDFNLVMEKYEFFTWSIGRKMQAEKDALSA